MTPQWRGPSAGHGPRKRGTRAVRALVVAAVVAAFAAPAAGQGRHHHHHHHHRRRHRAVHARASHARALHARASHSGAKAKEPRAKHDKTQVFNFEGLNIAGRLRTPELMYFLERARDELRRASLKRRSFIPEMVRSVDQESL